MNRYLKLVHMEVHRFRYVLLGLMALTVLCQFGAVVVTVRDALTGRQGELLRSGTADFGTFFPGGKLYFAWVMFHTQIWYALPVLTGVAVLCLYVFLIWYRDWFGRHPFVYRLLTLPTARRHIYLAKATAIMLFALSMIAFQLTMLAAQKLAFNLMVPSHLRLNSHFPDMIAANQVLDMLLPRRFDAFIVYYGLGCLSVLAVFTAILLERSYRLRGISYAIGYLLAITAAVLLPILVLNPYGREAYWYPGEIFAVEAIMLAAASALTVWLGFRLIDRKVCA